MTRPQLRMLKTGTMTLVMAPFLMASNCDLFRQLTSGPTPTQFGVQLVASGFTKPTGEVKPEATSCTPNCVGVGPLVSWRNRSQLLAMRKGAMTSVIVPVLSIRNCGRVILCSVEKVRTAGRGLARGQ